MDCMDQVDCMDGVDIIRRLGVPKIAGVCIPKPQMF